MLKPEATRPLRDPGIPGLKSNPDPGILENIIPGFFEIYYIKQSNNFKDFYWSFNQKFPKNPEMKMLGYPVPKNPGIPSIPG